MVSGDQYMVTFTTNIQLVNTKLEALVATAAIAAETETVWVPNR